MKTKFYFLTTLLFISFASNAQRTLLKDPAYKNMMYDMSINFYTVCDSAEAYFKTIDKDKKGSGYKPFLRWKHLNEQKYFPTGDRSKVNPYLPYQEFLRIKAESVAKNSLYSANMWSEEGPNDMGVITGHYAAGMGRAEHVKVNPTNKNQIYMASRSGGLWRTNDEGVSWTNHTDYLPASGANAIATKSNNFDEVIYNVQSGELKISFGVYRSTDGGNTFSPTTFVPSNVNYGGLGSGFKIYVIKYHPTIPNLVFIGTSQGLYRNTDNLTTTNWTVQFSGGDVYDINFHPTDPNIVYAYDGYYSANKNKIFKSTDGGVTYTGMPNLAGNNDKKIKIFTTVTCPDCVFLSSDNGIWKSTDAGATNITIQNPAPSGVSLWQAIPNDLDLTKYVSGYVDLYRSTDSGANFLQCTNWYLANAMNGTGSLEQNYHNSTSYVHADSNYLDCVNGVFYTCTDGFLCKSEDSGVTWVKLSENVNVRENYCLGVSQSNDKVAVFGSQDNGTSIKFDDNIWYEAEGADGMESIIHPLNYNAMIFSQQYGARFRSYNKGVNTDNINTFNTAGGAWVAPMFYDPNDHFTVYTFTNKTFKSTDFGTTWTQLGTPTTFTNGAQEAAIAESNSNKIAISNTNHLELSTDGGVTYTSIMGNLPSNLYISDVTFDPDNDNTMLVTYADVSSVYGQNKVFISYDSGATWTNITYNLGYMPVHNVIVAHGIIYIAAEVGVYYKSLTDTSWTLMYTNLPNVTVRELEVNYGANTLSAATWGRGYWKTNLIGRENHPKIVLTTTTHPVNFDTPKTSVDEFVTSNIEYAGTLTNVYVSWAVGTANFNSTDVIPMALVSGTTWKTTAPLPNNYPAGTKIYFKVTAVGSNADTSETYKFMYALKPFEYCAASGENNSGNLYIKRFQLSNIDNNNTANNQYTFYDTNPIILFKGDTYTATGTFNYAFNASDDFYIWIDYDKSAAFDANENVVANANNVPAGSDTQSSGTFTVPLNTPSHETRLRARYGYWGGYDNPCNTTLGEVEDYLVKIMDKPSITFTSNTNYCLNEDITLNYTGSTVQAVNWELDNGYNTFSFSGNSFTTNTLPVGTYTVKVLFTVENVVFTKDYPNYLRVSSTPSTVDITNTNQVVCANQVMSLSTTGGETVGNKFLKTTGTLVSNNTIPDNNLNTGFTQTFTINEFPNNATLTKVEVKLNMSHILIRDFRINLEAPNGKIVNLYNQHGDYGDNLTNTVITSDTNAAPFTNVNTAAPFTGTFRATLANQATIGTNPAVNTTNFSELFTIPNGDWKIRIYDDGANYIGTFHNATIYFTYNSSEVVWTPTTGLYTDANATIPYDGLPIAQNVYAKPIETITYSVKAVPESCSNTDTVTLNIAPTNKYTGGSWLNGTPPTIGGTAVLEFDDPAGFSSTTDISGCGCVVKQGNVVLNSNHTMRLEGQIKIEGGTFVVENGGSILQNSDIQNEGNILYKRNSATMANDLDYSYWASPVLNEKLDAIIPANKWFKYNALDGWIQITTPNTETMESGRGYIVRIPTAGTQNAIFEGLATNGSITINNLTAGTDAYYLLGNPYPSAIDLEAFYTDNNATVLKPTFYFWKHTTAFNGLNYNSGDYATYSTELHTGTLEGTNFVAAGQGFFAEILANGSITFKNEHRIASNNSNFYRTAQPQVQNTSISHKFWLNLTNENHLKQILIAYVQGATNGYDYIDATSFDGQPSLNLYTIADTKKLVIQARAPFIDTDMVTIGYKTSQAGTYTIAIDHLDDFWNNQNIYLKDNLLNTVHNIKNTSYNFTTEVGVFDNRFEIIYQTNALSNPDANFDNDVIVFSKNKDIHIKSSIKSVKEVTIYDVQGRLIKNLVNLDSNEIIIRDLFYSSQLLLIKIKTADDIIISKKNNFSE